MGHLSTMMTWTCLPHPHFSKPRPVYLWATSHQPPSNTPSVTLALLHPRTSITISDQVRIILRWEYQSILKLRMATCMEKLSKMSTRQTLSTRRTLMITEKDIPENIPLVNCEPQWHNSFRDNLIILHFMYVFKSFISVCNLYSACSFESQMSIKLQSFILFL